MDTIGTTNSGKLVMMTLEEHEEFRRLEDVVNGMEPNVRFDRSALGLHTDLGKVFSAIRVFAAAKFRLDELQEIVDRLRIAVEGDKRVEMEITEEEVTSTR